MQALTSMCGLRQTNRSSVEREDEEERYHRRDRSPSRYGKAERDQHGSASDWQSRGGHAIEGRGGAWGSQHMPTLAPGNITSPASGVLKTLTYTGWFRDQSLKGRSVELQAMVTARAEDSAGVVGMAVAGALVAAGAAETGVRASLGRAASPLKCLAARHMCAFACTAPYLTRTYLKR